MRTEAILSRMERVQKRRKRRRLLYRITGAILRLAVCLIGSALIVFIAVPVMEMLMQSWGSRLLIEFSVCYAGILWLVTKVYRME